MKLTIIFIHTIACFFIIICVLLQTNKGSSITSSFFNANSRHMFSNENSASGLLTKITAVVAVIFMLTSLIIGYIEVHENDSIVNMYESKNNSYSSGYNNLIEE